MKKFQIKLMIRDAIYRHSLDERKRSISVPTSFNDFRAMLSGTVTEITQSSTLARLFESNDPEIFTPMWDAWCYFDAELKECTSPEEIRHTWNEAVDFYTHDVIMKVLSRCGLGSNDVGIQLFTENVVRQLKDRISGNKPDDWKTV